MKERGHNRDPKQCCVKLKELRQAYQKTREANGHSRSEPKTCRFYDELHAILRGSATTTLAVLFDSFNGDGGNTEAGAPDRPYRGGQEHFRHDNDGYQAYCTICCHKAMGCCCVAMQYASASTQETYGDSELSGLHACRGMASAQEVSHNGHPDRSGQQFELLCPAPRYTGISPSPFKGSGIVEIPLLVCSAWTPHIPSSQLTRVAPCSKRSPTWSTSELLDMLALWGEKVVQSQLHPTVGTLIPTVRFLMLDKGYEVDTHQCCAKIKDLRQAYQNTREANRCSGAAPKTCRFYKELDPIVGGDPTNQEPCGYFSGAGGSRQWTQPQG
ncbi:hypothetical protein UY3_08595 [Chelonia mydas]|uniref:Myb/SANT-like DNA-binding domain-containing protein n=1 Tax=Chelonia mydas TaxID=8469 RepID=M7C1H2_CHEMY|nr:hypothetical protein UY3_08595 [Chelonia mydas]